MYTDKDLDDAVTRGIFTSDAVAEFRHQQALAKSTTAIDEENFRLIGGFNDIFVVIACALLLFSARWISQLFDPVLGLASFPILAWLLAEYFVRKRNLALPAIALLLAFVSGVFDLGLQLFANLNDWTFSAASGLTVVATYAHWRRFRVPITIAAGNGCGDWLNCNFAAFCLSGYSPVVVNRTVQLWCADVPVCHVLGCFRPQPYDTAF